MLGPFTRIVLRYVAGVLVANGIFSADTGSFFSTDPDVFAMTQAAIGLGIGVVTEAYYWTARKLGWAT